MTARAVIRGISMAVLAAGSVHAADLPRRPWLGAVISDSPGGGVNIERVFPGSSADIGGLRSGEVIHYVDGIAVETTQDLLRQLAGRQAGSDIALSIRDGQGSESRTLTLLPLPQEQSGGFETLYESVATAGAVRRTVITKPDGDGPWPAILFVGGIGCYPVDSPFDSGDTYRQLLSFLTERGFVTLRVEKSGIGDSSGPPCDQVDLSTEVAGYAAGLASLSTKPYVDQQAVFIVGHSIGGVVGPLVARTGPVRGVVGIATVGRTWFEYELINRRRHLVLAGFRGAEISSRMRTKQVCLNSLLVEGMSPEDILAGDPACADDLQYPASISYMRDLAAADFPAHWVNVDAPALLIYGASDYVTDREEHLILVDAINAAHPDHAVYREIPDMDHGLTEAASQQESYLRSESGHSVGALHPEVGPIIADWIWETLGGNADVHS